MKLENITKIYANGTKAVNGLNLKLYTDQVFVLLGHNGAGKTSTLDIITGLYNPTDGNASIFGVDMFKDFQKVRQFMGICPQHDVLFDLLTP
jgi:ATP-binding cassette subfamily A (ABC1) protein 3